MNILFITNELRYTCGVTNHILHLTRGLSGNASNKIYIIYGGGNGPERFSEIDTELIENVNFRHKDRSYLKYLAAIRFLGNFIKEKDIDVIHSHTHYAANIAKSAADKSKAITIQTNHGLLANEGRLKHFTADKYIAINEHIYEHIIKNNIAADKDVSLIRCGIPVPVKPPEKNNERIKIIAASRFVKGKGLDVYINAIAQLPDAARRNADFYMAGEGEMENTLKGMNDFFDANITFLGSVPDMHKVLSGTDVFVFPSRSPHEGFPAIITEAGANNNLVITSDFSALGNMIENNKNGLVFEQENYKELAGLLKKVIENPEKHKPMAKKFYKRVKELFSLDEMLEKHEKLYEECL